MKIIGIVRQKPMKRDGLSLAVYAGLLVVLVILTSCSAMAPEPTATPAPTETPVPTGTFTAEPTQTETPTPRPTSTPEPPSPTPEELVLPMPEGELLAEWQGYPIMPGAIAGEEDDGVYVFVIEASPDAVGAFYQKELAKLGYMLMSIGTNDAGETKMMMFTGSSGALSIFFIPQEDGLLYVSMVSI